MAKSKHAFIFKKKIVVNKLHAFKKANGCGVLHLSGSYPNMQLTFLVVLSSVIGWHLLYEGIANHLVPEGSSCGLLIDSKAVVSGIFITMAHNKEAIALIDFLNICGLMAIGTGLIIVFFTRVARVAGIVLLGLYYISHPSFPGLRFALPVEVHYLIVNKNLGGLFAMVILWIPPTGHVIGLDRFTSIKYLNGGNHYKDQ